MLNEIYLGLEVEANRDLFDRFERAGPVSLLSVQIFLPRQRIGREGAQIGRGAQSRFRCVPVFGRLEPPSKPFRVSC
jgi:hypothetical protein